jgi:hypothetical protein
MTTANTNFSTATVDRMTRVTLNGGLINRLDDEDARLVEEFLAKNKVTKCPPAGVTGNEASRSTNELVAKQRRNYRKTNK